MSGAIPDHGIKVIAAVQVTPCLTVEQVVSHIPLAHDRDAAMLDCRWRSDARHHSNHGADSGLTKRGGAAGCRYRPSVFYFWARDGGSWRVCGWIFGFSGLVDGIGVWVAVRPSSVSLVTPAERRCQPLIAYPVSVSLYPADRGLGFGQHGSWLALSRPRNT